jgi:putative nucleotidyltransferase with HDIG domain
MDLNEPGRRRILFVDDEVKVLDGLKRMLYPMRKEWDMAFAESAQEALEALALDPFEVIVTDMRMPGTDGTELLGQIMQLYPEIVRIVLSGQWEPEMSIRSAKTAHQYLTKPCSAEALKATLDRMFALRRMLAGRSLRRLVSGMTTLPSLPVAHQKLMAALATPHASIAQVEKIMGGDMAMTAKVLQLANSAFFGVSRQVINPADATRYLGVETIRALAVTIGVFAPFQGPEQAGRLLARVQRHCLETGRIVQIIAKIEQLEKKTTDTAFLAALLHDIGKLILISKDPEMYESAAALASTERLDMDPVEREMFGASHAEVGRYLLWLWGLPEPIVDTVAFHHCPAAYSTQGLSPVAVVHAADVLAHNLEPCSDPAPRLDESFLAAAGLSERMTEWREQAYQEVGAEETA